MLRAQSILPALALTSCVHHTAEPFDIILEGGSVYNGSNSPAVITDVGIRADRIVSMGNLANKNVTLRLIVTGLAVVPGFVDIHSHEPYCLRVR